MDFVAGAPLSQLREELKRRGIEIEPGSLAEQARRVFRGMEFVEDFMVLVTVGYMLDLPPTHYNSNK